MIAIAVAGLVAVLAVLGLSEPLPVWTALVPLAALPFARRHPWARLLLAAAFMAALAATLVAARRADRLAPELDGARLELAGRIVSLPEPAGRAWRFEFAPESRPSGVPRRVRVLWYGEAPMPQAAERWRLELRLRAPRGFANPGGFDYEAWLFERGIGALGSGERGERLAGADPGWLAWRAALAARIAAHCAGRPVCGVVQGLAVGHLGAIETARWQTYRATGTLHLVAISGLHVTLLASLAFLVARAAWARIPPFATRVPASVAAGALALGVATVYAALAGFGVPARRTLLMLAVAFGAAACRRPGTGPGTLAAALAAVLATDPFAARAPGFWLSFAGVAVLIAATRPAAGAWERAWRGQFAVGVGLAPVLGAAFGVVPLAAPLANAIAIPAFNLVAVPATLAGLVLLPWAPALGGFAIDLACTALERVQPVLDVLAATVPELAAPGGSPAGVALGCAALAGVLALAPRGLPGRALAPLLGLPLFMPVLELPEVGAFRLAVLDVGQGHAAVISTRHHTLIYDAGPAFGEGDAGDMVVAPYLRALGRRPDLLVVSHADSDHAGGAASLRRAWPALPVLAGEDHARIGPALPCRAGRRWTWDGVRFEILAPRAGDEGASGNARSCVLSVRGPATGALLSGDLPGREERALAAARGGALGHAVLVSPHHGSAGSSTDAFVAAVGARHVIHAAGHRNRWGFPRPEVVARYDAAGARQWATGASGALLVAIAADGRVTLERWRERDARLWRQP